MHDLRCRPLTLLLQRPSWSPCDCTWGKTSRGRCQTAEDAGTARRERNISTEPRAVLRWRHGGPGEYFEARQLRLMLFLMATEGVPLRWYCDNLDGQTVVAASTESGFSCETLTT